MDVSKANASGRARSKKGAALGETSTNARSPTRSEVCGIVTQSCRSGYSGPHLHSTKVHSLWPHDGLNVPSSVADAWSLLDYTRLASQSHSGVVESVGGSHTILARGKASTKKI